MHSGTLALIYWVKVSEAIFVEWLGLGDRDYFLLTSAICWIQLRSISYSVDNIKSQEHLESSDFLENLMLNVAYSLYLPTLFFGPVILYQEFVDGVRIEKIENYEIFAFDEKSTYKKRNFIDSILFL